MPEKFKLLAEKRVEFGLEAAPITSMGDLTVEERAALIAKELEFHDTWRWSDEYEMFITACEFRRNEEMQQEADEYESAQTQIIPPEIVRQTTQPCPATNRHCYLRLP